MCALTMESRGRSYHRVHSRPPKPTLSPDPEGYPPTCDCLPVGPTSVAPPSLLPHRPTLKQPWNDFASCSRSRGASGSSCSPCRSGGSSNHLLIRREHGLHALVVLVGICRVIRGSGAQEGQKPVRKEAHGTIQALVATPSQCRRAAT